VRDVVPWSPGVHYLIALLGGSPRWLIWYGGIGEVASIFGTEVVVHTEAAGCLYADGGKSSRMMARPCGRRGEETASAPSEAMFR